MKNVFESNRIILSVRDLKHILLLINSIPLSDAFPVHSGSLNPIYHWSVIKAFQLISLYAGRSVNQTWMESRKYIHGEISNPDFILCRVRLESLMCQLSPAAGEIVSFRDSPNDVIRRSKIKISPVASYQRTLFYSLLLSPPETICVGR